MDYEMKSMYSKKRACFFPILERTTKRCDSKRIDALETCIYALFT